LLATSKASDDIRTSYWDHDINLLLRQIKPVSSGVVHTTRNDPYPLNPPEGRDPVSDEKLKVFLDTELLKWKKKVSPLPEDPENIRVELHRGYRFKSFRDAIGFMSQVAPGCEIALHHPRSENLWKSVRVYFTTWDIGRRISDRDIQLARYFDRAYSKFPGADPGVGA
jgi:pterin-4a-carbinolamine dehydratase